MEKYKKQIENATSGLELSCIWEDIRNDYYNNNRLNTNQKNALRELLTEKRRALSTAYKIQ